LCIVPNPAVLVKPQREEAAAQKTQNYETLLYALCVFTFPAGPFSLEFWIARTETLIFWPATLLRKGEFQCV